jgi:hypothetical protein
MLSLSENKSPLDFDQKYQKGWKVLYFFTFFGGEIP